MLINHARGSLMNSAVQLFCRQDTHTEGLASTREHAAAAQRITGLHLISAHPRKSLKRNVSDVERVTLSRLEFDPGWDGKKSRTFHRTVFAFVRIFQAGCVFFFDTLRLAEENWLVGIFPLRSRLVLLAISPSHVQRNFIHRLPSVHRIPTHNRY